MCKVDFLYSGVASEIFLEPGRAGRVLIWQQLASKSGDRSVNIYLPFVTLETLQKVPSTSCVLPKYALLEPHQVEDCY